MNHLTPPELGKILYFPARIYHYFKYRSIKKYLSSPEFKEQLKKAKEKDD